MPQFERTRVYLNISDLQLALDKLRKDTEFVGAASEMLGVSAAVKKAAATK
jgi:hypothetical protein